MELTVKLFSPHDGQRKVIESFSDSDHKFGIVSTGRQFGKSLLASNLLVYWLLNNSGSRGAWISPIYNQGKKVFGEILNACKDIVESSNKADLTMRFVNGSTIQFLSAERPDSIRGFSFNYLIIDEAAYIREEALTAAILPTLTAIGKKCLVISTPKGKGNWFYNYYLRGIQSNDQYISFQGISTDNTYVDLSFIEEQRKSLPEDIFRQEYMAEFVDGGNDVFRNLDNVCILDGWPEITRGENYFAGIDVGISDDYTVLTVLGASGRVYSCTRVNRKPIAEIGRILSNELRRFPNITGYCETNGIGRAIYEEVRRDVRSIRGFTTSNDNKVQAIRGLIQDIEEGIIELPSKKLMPEVYQEFASFSYKLGQNGKLHFSHPPGMHDDIVDSIWMANVARNEIRGGGASKIYVGNSQQYTAARFG
jgi:hypothetical protein